MCLGYVRGALMVSGGGLEGRDAGWLRLGGNPLGRGLTGLWAGFEGTGVQ